MDYDTFTKNSPDLDRPNLNKDVKFTSLLLRQLSTFDSCYNYILTGFKLKQEALS